MITRIPLLAAVAITLGGATAHAELQAPTGPVVLTVIGDIENSNRGAVDPAVDRLMTHHEQEFPSAAAFDQTMLEALGMESRRFALKSAPLIQEIEGPTLAAVLEAAGAPAKAAVSAVALDGFQAEIDAESLAHRDWLLGLKRNGVDLGIGDFGPTWLVFSPASPNLVAVRDESSTWPYQVFLIRVMAE